MRSAILAVLLVLVAADTAYASGFTFPETGTRAIGRGGTGTASTRDAGATYFNPAALTRINGFNLSFSGTLPVYRMRFQRAPYAYTDNTGTDVTVTYDEVTNEPVLFPVPNLFLAHNFGSDVWSLGIGLYPPSSTKGRRYERPSLENPVPNSPDNPDVTASRNGGGGYMILETDLLGAYGAVSAALHLRDINLSFGASAQLLYARATVSLGVEGSGIYEASAAVRSDDNPGGYFVDEAPGLFIPTTLETGGFAAAAIFGVLWEPTPNIAVGLSYRTAHTLRTRGSAAVEVPPGLQSDLISLEIDGDRAGLDLKFPHILRAAIDYRKLSEGGSPLWDIEFDFVYEMWSRLDTFHADLDGRVRDEIGLLGPEGRQLPDITLGRYYRNTWSARIGFEVDALRDRESGTGLGLRSGILYESGASPSEWTNLDFTSFDRFGASIGASYYIKNLSVDAGFLFIKSPERVVTNGRYEVLNPLWICNAEPDNEACRNNGDTSPSHATNNGSYNVHYLIFSLGLTYGF